MQQIQKPNRNKEASDIGRFFICNIHVVRSLDRLWNQFEPDLYRLQEKLEHAGLTLIDGEVTYNEENSDV